MVDVNTIDLKSYIDNLDTMIGEYNEIILNLFNQLNNSLINWHDGNSFVFEKKIYEEKKEALLVLDSLESKKELCNFVYHEYVEIGKKIRCNLNNKDSVINLINKCYIEANTVAQAFNGVDLSYYGGEIISAKNKIISAKNKLSQIKNSVSNMYKRIEEIEKKINIKIKELEIIKINSFDFNLV